MMHAVNTCHPSKLQPHSMLLNLLSDGFSSITSYHFKIGKYNVKQKCSPCYCVSKNVWLCYTIYNYLFTRVKNSKIRCLAPSNFLPLQNRQTQCEAKMQPLLLRFQICMVMLHYLQLFVHQSEKFENSVFSAPWWTNM